MVVPRLVADVGWLLSPARPLAWRSRAVAVATAAKAARVACEAAVGEAAMVEVAGAEEVAKAQRAISALTGAVAGAADKN